MELILMGLDVFWVFLDRKLTLFKTGATYIANNISLLIKSSVCAFYYNINI